MELRHLTDADVADAAEVFVTSLGHQPPKDTERFRRSWHVESSLGAFDDDGRLLGVTARFPSRFTAVGGAPLSCSAVPAVGVRPDQHRRGIGRALLERQVAEAVERGDALLALNASEVQIYGRFGYGPTSTWWSVEADPRMVRWRDDAPRAAPSSIEEVDPETAHRLLPDLHERCFGRWGGELARHDGWWFSLFQPRPDRTPSTIAVHRGSDGTVDAAARYAVTQKFDAMGFANEVELHDLFGVDPATEALLLRWLLERRLTGRFHAVRCSPRTPIEWMMDDGRRLQTTAADDAVWVRVLDLTAAISARTTLATGAVVVGVTDQLVAANQRSWRIADDGAGGLTCTPDGGTPDVTLDVQFLAPVLWGYTAPSRLAAAGRIAVHDPAGLATLDRLLAVTEPSWCSTAF